MARENFETCLKYVLIDEGGNDDDPQDRGGRTSRGITQREYNSWCTLNNKPAGDVWSASDADVRTIYHDQYWNPYCDSLPSGIDYCFFDISVNSGRTAAVRNFQKALGVQVDGMMGQVTRAAIQNHPDVPQLIRDILEIRRNYYRALSQFPRYGKGWLNRADHLEQGAMALASKSNYTRVDRPAMPKASEDLATKATVSPEAAGTTAASAGGLSGLIDQFKSAIEPYQYTLKIAGYILMGVAVVSFGYMVYGVMLRRKAQAAI